VLRRCRRCQRRRSRRLGRCRRYHPLGRLRRLHRFRRFRSRLHLGSSGQPDMRHHSSRSSRDSSACRHKLRCTASSPSGSCRSRTCCPYRSVRWRRPCCRRRNEARCSRDQRRARHNRSGAPRSSPCRRRPRTLARRRTPHRTCRNSADRWRCRPCTGSRSRQRLRSRSRFRPGRRSRPSRHHLSPADSSKPKGRKPREASRVQSQRSIFADCSFPLPLELLDSRRGATGPTRALSLGKGGRYP